MVRPTVAGVLAELERSEPGLAELLAGSADREIHSVWLAEDLRELDGCPRQALVLLSRTASQHAQGYKLDVALRRLGDVAGLVLQAEAPRPSLSALALARREDLPLVRLTRSADVTQLLSTVIRMLDAQLPTLLERAIRVCRDIDRLETGDISDEDLVRDSGAAELFGLTLGSRDPRLSGVPAVMTEPDGPWLQREPTVTSEDSLAELSMWRLCAAMTKRSIETDRAEQLCMLSAGELLNQLLDPGTDDSGPLLRRAADIGVRVEGWNQVIILEFANLLALAEDDPVTAYRYTQTVSRVAAQTASQQEGRWTMAPRAGGMLLLRTGNHPEGPAGLRRLRSAVQTVLDRALESFPGVHILCGIGGSHEGLQGLRASRAEADAALQSARLRGASNEPVLFDAPGLSRLLVEWYSSSSVRQSVDDLFAPLADLGEARQKEYSTTLRVYLENNRSVSRTSRQLYLHRNTVTYRINRILGVLGVDLDDPNQFLAVYLACYAQSMSHCAGGLRRGPEASVEG
ncbi:PucR family transcriptional regulator [Pseudonocardia acidicola]|uniref:PucR family transcriptional regulator n=1 Tax=Pseudonocardia acidicola TaxID=2724939 RepID=A0ABX1SA25_9PSEU|nr:helix-turn-helix domain-containing protein [Pseudonocardia acidicola]NMH98420.1 PucR family transcriptional regulator [Pseudonocardia acidicola]